MDADDQFRHAVYEAIQEVRTDPMLAHDPERELERLRSMLESMFWVTWQEVDQRDEHRASTTQSS